MYVFYDNWCPNCTRFATWVKKIDRRKAIVFIRIRAPLPNEFASKIDQGKALKQMASVIEDKVYYGFDSIFFIFLRVPSLWLFVPFLAFLKRSKLGDYLYTELALKRKIIPMGCDDQCIITPRKVF